MEVVSLIFVLIFDGLSETSPLYGGKAPTDLCDIYIPYLVSSLRTDGIACEVMKLQGLYDYFYLCGKNRDCLIYAPTFILSDERKSNISLIYTDSTHSGSISFRIADALRKKREETFGNVVFVNGLHEQDTLRKCCPIIVDTISVNREKSEISLGESLKKNADLLKQSILDIMGENLS